MQKNSQNFSMQEALRLANSDAGQQLLALLKQSGGEQLQQASPAWGEPWAEPEMSCYQLSQSYYLSDGNLWKEE